MLQYIIGFSKYYIALFAALYTYECFAVFRFRREEERRGIYIRQNILMFLVHFGCFLPIYAKTSRMEYLFLFLFQQVCLYTVIVLYRMLYPRSNRLAVNNMCFLMAIGFIELMRLSYEKALRQFVIVAVSLAVSLIVPELTVRVKNWRDFTWAYAITGIAALGLVLALGAVTNGSKLAFSVFGVSFQPSEFVKILFVFFVSSLLCRSLSFPNVLLSAIVAGVHILILALSKDLGSALIYFVTYFTMVYAATGNALYLLAGAVGGSGASYLAYRFFSHVQVRVQAWRDPWSVIDGAGYQITQSLFAIGCGGLFGLGIYQGSPKSIPYVETDFIFSAIAEEMGLLFALCLILIFISCFLMFMRIGMSMQDDFYRLAAAGLGVTYIFQIFLTIGGGIKLIPLTGVTLPFISYGGSSVLSTILMFSIVQGLYLSGGKKRVHSKEKKDKKAEKPGNYKDND